MSRRGRAGCRRRAGKSTPRPWPAGGPRWATRPWRRLSIRRWPAILICDRRWRVSKEPAPCWPGPRPCRRLPCSLAVASSVAVSAPTARNTTRNARPARPFPMSASTPAGKSTCSARCKDSANRPAPACRPAKRKPPDCGWASLLKRRAATLPYAVPSRSWQPAALPWPPCNASTNWCVCDRPLVTCRAANWSARSRVSIRHKRNCRGSKRASRPR